jgi:hypothetical protein
MLQRVRKLNDIEAHERLHDAALALGNEGGLTPAGDTALTSARVALVAFQMALVKAMEAPPKEDLPPPPY